MALGNRTATRDVLTLVRHPRVLATALTVVAVGAACGTDRSSRPPDVRLVDTVLVATSAAREPATPATEPAPAGLSLQYGAITERNLDAGADGQNTTAAVTGMNVFAIDLFRTVAAQDAGNVVVSPYSVSSALSMLYAGASGQTAAEMAAVLHADLPAEDWHEGINAYDLTLDARTAGSPTTWSAASRCGPLRALRCATSSSTC